MKRFYLSILSIAAAAGVMLSQTTIYAYRTWQRSNPDNTDKGPVKFQSDNPASVTLIADQSKLGQIYAGTYYNYKWYAQVTKPGTQTSLEGLYTIDTATGERTLITTAGRHLVEMTYDYTTDTMYGVLSGAFYLATIDLSTGEVKQIGKFDIPGEGGILALACDLSGQLYGISADDNLYRIDKATASCALVGGTGVNAAFTQSMDFDRNSGILYWANNGDYTLYTVDTETGKATKIGPIGADGEDSTASLFVPYIHAAAGAPDRVTGRKASASGKNVTLEWVNPATDAQGKPLTELTAVKIFRDGALIATVSDLSGKIGQPMTYLDENLSDGLYTYRFVPANAKGDGGTDSDNIDIRVGQDAPGAVTDFKAVAGDNTAELSWGKPDKGLHGDAFDPASITKYTITRTSGAGSSTIDVTDPETLSYIDRPGFGTYTYSIQAVNEIGPGAAATAEPIIVKPADWIVMTSGEAIVESGKTYHFYDISGPNAYYPNSRQDVLTLRPASPNGLIHVAFKKFETDTYGDYLRIYDGASVESPLIGEYTSETVPADLVSLESTSGDGCLTFEFYSDIMDRREGWEADVTATEKLQNDLVAKKLTGDLYPEAGGKAAYALEVFNKGIAAVAAGDYKIKLVDSQENTLAESDGVALASMESATVALQFTPAAASEIELHAEITFANDGDPGNNSSNTLSVNVLEQGSRYITIGRNDGDVGVMPISFMAGETISEALYPADEIGLSAGKLRMVGYDYASVGTNYPSVPIEVWIGETDKTDLTDGTVPANELTKVFSGNIAVSTDDTELVIPVAEPYSYNGRNLVILIQKHNPGATSYDIMFKGTYGTSDDPKLTRFDSKFIDGETFDPNATFASSAGTMFPQTKLLFTDAKAGVDTAEAGGAALEVYPNPVRQTLTVKGAGIRKVELLSMSGSLLLTRESDGLTAIDMSAFPQGVYLLKTIDGNGRSNMRKILKK